MLQSNSLITIPKKAQNKNEEILKKRNPPPKHTHTHTHTHTHNTLIPNLLNNIEMFSNGLEDRGVKLNSRITNYRKIILLMADPRILPVLEQNIKIFK